jgi:hypothetical protein
MLRWFAPAVLAAALAAGACAEPPNTEMDQAQGALDAARAAGAEQYARDEYRAAADALKRSHEAVAQSDYRLALNHALDSRERAQNAARQAAEGKAQARSEADRLILEVTGPIVQGNARLEAARRARVARSRLAAPALEVARISVEVQKARAMLNSGQDIEARDLLQALKLRMQKTMAAIDQAASPPSARRRR